MEGPSRCLLDLRLRGHFNRFVGPQRLVSLKRVLVLVSFRLTPLCSRWCGATGSVSSSYQESLTSFANLPVAAYFSEYGCNTDSPRTWTEVAAIYGDSSVAQVYSGGVAFSYFPTNDAKDFGITTLSGDTVTTTVEFDNLVTALTNITTFINTPAKSAATQPAFSTCPPTSDAWTASPNVIIFPFSDPASDNLCV